MPVQVCRLGLPVLASVRFRGNAGPRGRHQAPFTVDQGKALLATSAGPRRVVVTGIGAVTPLGKSADASWDALVSGCSGVTAVPADGGYDGIPAQIAAFVKKAPDHADGFCSDDWNDGTLRNNTPDCFKYGLAAARQAVASSGWKAATDRDMARAGISFGCSLPGLQDFDDAVQTFARRGPRRVSPMVVPHMLTNMVGGLISMQHNLRGPNHCVSTACATGAHALGDAFRFIKYGDADLMVCGGADGGIHPVIMAGFSQIKALATGFNARPELASRPFSRDRQGFVIGEGAGAMVLEEREHALARGATVYAEVLGYGLSGDASHITAPSPDGRGAAACMSAALAEAHLEPSEVDYVNAHATSTPMGDDIENSAIKAVFGRHAHRLAISSTKGATGHLLGAAGAVESVFCVFAISKGVVPPTMNLEAASADFDLDYVPKEARQQRVRIAVNNSFGFGGTNASLVFGPP